MCVSAKTNFNHFCAKIKSFIGEIKKFKIYSQKYFNPKVEIFRKILYNKYRKELIFDFKNIVFIPIKKYIWRIVIKLK